MNWRPRLPVIRLPVRRVPVILVPVIVGVAILAGLPGSSAWGAGTPSLSAWGAGTPSLSAPCAWFGESDQRDVNIGAPDLDAYYVADALPISAGERVQIRGQYPFARYFSFHVYSDRTLLPLATVYDQQISPDRYSGNPFRRAVRAGLGQSYTVHIAFGARPRRPAANTMYVNPRGLGPSALLIYRIYVPTDATSPSGGVSYPEVNIENSRGSTILSESGCATVTPPGGSKVFEAFARMDYPTFLPSQNVPGAHRIPVWIRAFGSRLGNEQNAYLWTKISRQYGQLVVIHARAASFPNNRRGQPVFGHHQLRYWSFCTYDAQGEAGYGCAADYAAAVRSGYITYVVSDPGSRPANAVARDGVTWLPWGGDQYSAQIMERNMLPAAGFARAIQRVSQTGPSSDPRSVMGPYYPRAAYCSTRLFMRGGWRACFRASGLPT